MSDLRTRIATIVVSVIGDSLGSGTELGLDIADAVIRELGLRREFALRDGPDAPIWAVVEDPSEWCGLETLHHAGIINEAKRLTDGDMSAQIKVFGKDIRLKWPSNSPVDESDLRKGS